MRRARGALGRLTVLAGALAAVCGPPPPGALTPDASVLLPQLADPASIYRGLGFFARGEPLPFVASVHFLAGPTPDSTFAVFGLSLANRALAFRRAPRALEARYRVEVVFRQGPRIVAQLSSDQEVRVGSLEEARRADESVVFQHFFHLPPGRLDGSVTVRDRNRLTASHDEQTIDVPRYGDGPALSQLVLVYRARPRRTRGALPMLLVNPRATSPQGARAGAGGDTLRFYLEGYGVPPGRAVYLRAVGPDSATVWRDTVQLAPAAPGADTAMGAATAVRMDTAAGEDTSVRAGMPAHVDSAVAGAPLDGAMVAVGPRELPLGRLQFEVSLAGGADTARTIVLVTFSEQWAVTNLDGVLSLLRLFGHDSALAVMRRAPAEERATLWRAFWRRTDPDTTTPENEALAAYFRRVEIANVRYSEGGQPGWLTDRGEVYITLGEPDRVDRSDDLRVEGGGTIRWTYRFDGKTVVLYFVNDPTPRRFRLTFSSRVEYQRVLERVRKGQTRMRMPG